MKDTDDKMKLLSFAGSERDIADPWYTGNFDETYADVLEGCTALLFFYEQNNLSAFKRIFVEQAEFAVHEYF